ncbi:MAG: hypothetical protein H8E17_12390 [Deltaproteobacteria bacterium]|nr:hypothetical protein [Deltaproteobacteria bacterium]
MVIVQKFKDKRDYYKSTQWQKIRQRILKKFDYICVECGDNGNQVHHLTYDRLYNEKDSDLVLVCEQCHKEIHDYDRYSRAVDTYMCKRYGVLWSLNHSMGRACEMFDDWIESKE